MGCVEEHIGKCYFKWWQEIRLSQENITLKYHSEKLSKLLHNFCYLEKKTILIEYGHK